MALVVFVLIVAACFLLPTLGVTEIGGMSVRKRLTPPGAEYWLGADAFGRDLLGRLLVAGQTSLGIGLGVAVASLWVGLSGLYRRLRGKQPHPMVANPWWSVFYLVFGAWVIWVFAISPAP